jgi:hypothetical protein
LAEQSVSYLADLLDENSAAWTVSQSVAWSEQSLVVLMVGKMVYGKVAR